MKRLLCLALLITTLSCQVSTNYVDLGVVISSVDGSEYSLYWAECNLGAATPYDAGDHYAWGETGIKDDSGWDTHKWCDDKSNKPTKYNKSDAKRVLDLEDDAAYIKLGEKWRMPTIEEWAALRHQCTWKWLVENGVSGYRVTGPNGNSIFLPAAGYSYNGEVYEVGEKGDYWSASLNRGDCEQAQQLHFDEDEVIRDFDYRGWGYSIRPVCNSEITMHPRPSLPAIPQHAVDLGLSVKWSSANLGAKRPSDAGDYYSWGDIEPNYSSVKPLAWKRGKSGYNLESYKFFLGREGGAVDLSKYVSETTQLYCGEVDNKKELDPEDDAVYHALGGNWRTPTASEWEELITQCEWTWTTMDDMKGYKVVGRNGNSIFLPASGFWGGDRQKEFELEGAYLSKSLYREWSMAAVILKFDSFEHDFIATFRHLGYTIRPVTE